MSQRFVVIVTAPEAHTQRAFGVFRSFKAADNNARAWGGYVLPLEKEDADKPWDASAYPG